MKGAWPFIVLFSFKFGPENLFVISRVNYFPDRGRKHWVQKFLLSIGIGPSPAGIGVPEDNKALCLSMHGPQGKGPIAKKLGITHYVDDNADCLWSFACDEAGHAAAPAAAFFFDETRRWRGYKELQETPAMRPLLRKCGSFKDLGEYFGLATESGAWKYLDDNGPPYIGLGPVLGDLFNPGSSEYRPIEDWLNLRMRATAAASAPSAARRPRAASAPPWREVSTAASAAGDSAAASAAGDSAAASSHDEKMSIGPRHRRRRGPMQSM